MGMPVSVTGGCTADSSLAFPSAPINHGRPCRSGATVDGGGEAAPANDVMQDNTKCVTCG